MRALKSVLFPIHPEGYRFIGIFAFLTLLLFFVSDFLGWVGVILTLWCAWFFRDRRGLRRSARGWLFRLPMAWSI